jgi:hypothetical protein
MKNINVINTWLLLVSVCLLCYLSFVKPKTDNEKLNKCINIAVDFERARHPSGDLEVTNQDISSFQKNVMRCIADTSN